LDDKALKLLLAEQQAGTPIPALAIKWGLTITQTRKHLETARGMIPKEFQGFDLGTPFSLEGDFLIVGDVHVPATDWGFAQMVSRLADKSKINRLIIAGDFFTMDSFSQYAATVPPVTWAQERDAARVLLLDWLETFAEIYTLQGNHDRRLTKWAQGELSESDIYGMAVANPKLHHSKFGYCEVKSAGIPWRITHPANYGRNQLTLLSDLANKYQSNIIGLHEHHTAIGWDVYKRFVICNCGMLADEKKMAYVSLDDNRTAGMAKSFVMLQGGVATPLGLYPFTDWSRLLA
jgi:predicted phosphodiesterase